VTKDQLSPSEFSLPVDSLLKDSDEPKDKFDDDREWLRTSRISKSPFFDTGSSGTFGGGGKSTVGGAVGG
jgi:hypothetical protein